MTSIKVALVDDHQLVRDGIKSLLESMDNIEVAAEASDGHEAIAIASSGSADIIVMDIAMARLNGLEATRRIVADDENAKVIILSMHDGEEYVVRAMRNGASGYLVKSAVPDELETAIRQIAAGAVYLSPSIGGAMRSHIMKQRSEPDGQDALTSRQMEILQAIAEGSSTKEIAERLFISPKTVETHRSQLMQKLDIHDIPGLVRYAIREGIISAG